MKTTQSHLYLQQNFKINFLKNEASNEKIVLLQIFSLRNIYFFHHFISILSLLPLPPKNERSTSNRNRWSKLAQDTLIHNASFVKQSLLWVIFVGLETGNTRQRRLFSFPLSLYARENCENGTWRGRWRKEKRKTDRKEREREGIAEGRMDKER